MTSPPAQALAPMAVGDSISGSVFRDTNANGTFDASPPAAGATVEVGFGGITVELRTPGTDALVTSTTTAPDGTYTFADVPDGTYDVVVTAPDAFDFLAVPTPPDNLAVRDAVAPGNPQTGRIPGVVIVAGSSALNQDVGLRPRAELAVQIATRPDSTPAIDTGTAPFDADDSVGNDSSPTNSITRTNDVTRYTWSIRGDNNVAPIDNVIFEQTLIPAGGAVPYFDVATATGLPLPCVGTTPPSSIVNNPDGSVTLTCNIGPVDTEAVVLDIGVKADGRSPNGSSFTSTSRVYSAIDDAVPDAGPTTAPISITGRPELNTIKPGPAFTETVSIAGELYYQLYYLPIISMDRAVGGAAVQSPMTFGEDFDPANLYPNAELFMCTEPFLFPTPGAGTNNFSDPRLTSTNGAITCAAGTASGPLPVTVTGADTSGRFFPTQTQGGGPLPATWHPVTAMQIGVRVPMTDFYRHLNPAWQAGDPVPSGTVPITNCLTGFDPNGLDGTSNFGDGFEPGWDGTTSSGDNCATSGFFVTSGEGGTSKIYRNGDVPSTYPDYQNNGINYDCTPGVWIMCGETVPGGAGVSGDGGVFPGYRFMSLLIGGNAGLGPIDQALVCDAWDNQTVRLAPFTFDANRSVRVNQTGPSGRQGDIPGWVIEYASIDADGQAGTRSWGSDHVGALSNDLYTIDNPAQKAAIDNCDAADVDGDGSNDWTADPATTFGPDWRDVVNMVRIRTGFPDTPGATAGIPPLTTVQAEIQLEGRNTFYGGPHDGEVIPQGVLVPNYAGGSYDGTYAGTGAFDPNTQFGGGGANDRAIFRRGMMTLGKTASADTAEPGTAVSWSLAPAVTATTPGYSFPEVTITDTLPTGVLLDLACSQAANPTASIQVGASTPTGTTVTVALGSLAVNEPVPPITLCTTIADYVQPGTNLVNTAIIDSPDDLSDEVTRTAQDSVLVVGTGRLGVQKSVDQQVDEANDDQVWTLSWINSSATLAVLPIDLIDVFPWNGDAAPTSLSQRNLADSDYSGTLQLTAPLPQPVDGSGAPIAGTWTYTSAAPATVNHDATDPSNGAGGATVWCAPGSFGTPGCPADLAAVTAVRFTASANMPAQSTATASYALQANGNLPQDRYVNRAAARSATFAQLIRSNEPYVQVVGFTAGDYVFSDVDGNGAFTAGVDTGIANVSVEVLGAGGVVVATRTTDADGRWFVDRLPAGDYQVRLPAANFAPGGPLFGRSPTVNPADPNADANESVDHNAPATPSPATTGVTSAPFTLSATTAGAVITGDEPVGDNPAGLGDPLVLDTMTNFTVDMGFLAPADLAITKAVVGAPVANGDGTYAVTYDVTVANAGPSSTTYTLTDALQFGAGITAGSPAVSNTVPGGLAVSGTWNGTSDTTITANAAIAGNASHTYRVSVVADVPMTSATATSSDCTLDPGETGTGLMNGATLSDGATSDPASACVPVPSISHDKQAVSMTPIGNGQWQAVYTVTVTNSGAGAGTYDLSDTLQLGAGITVASAQVTVTPASVIPVAGWNGSSATALADDAAIGAAGSPDAVHVYTLTVVADVPLDLVTDTGDAGDCTPPAGGGGSGLLNSSTLTVNGETAGDTACPGDLPSLNIDKEIDGQPTALGNGQWQVEYLVNVNSEGAVGTTYTLNDQLGFGTGLGITSVDVANEAPGTIATNADFDGAGNTLIAGDVSIDANVTHTYRVTVVATLDPSAATPAGVTCAPGGATGLFNTASLGSNGSPAPVTDDGCGGLPYITQTKDLLGPPVPVPGEPGVYEATYALTVRNLGGAAGTYDLTDTLTYGTGLAVVSADVTTTVPAGLPVNGDWDGTADPAVASGVDIAAGDTHVYTVVVHVNIDDDAVTTESADCTRQAGEAGTGFSNESNAAWNGLDSQSADCEPARAVTFAKRVVSAVPDGDGGWRVTYEVTVSNTGPNADSYALDDRLHFAAGTTVDAVEVTNAAPGTIVPNPGWDGAGSTSIVAAQPIGPAGTPDAVHVYRIVVDATVPLTQPSAASTDCTLAAGETGTGLLNAATLGHDGEVRADDACTPMPSLTMAKTVAAGPTWAGDHWRVDYQLTVTNSGAGGGVYTLTDGLTYGAGLNVVSAVVTSAPAGVATNGAWNGGGDTTVAADQAIPGGAVHTYTVSVGVTVDRTAVTPQSLDCTLEPGESGSGLMNGASLSAGESATSGTCATVPVIDVDKSVVSAQPASNGQWNVTYDVTVTNRTPVATSYSLSDNLAFGDGISVVSAAIASTSPPSLATNAAWNGRADPVVASGQPIGALAAHTYRIVVTAHVPPKLTASATDCTFAGGEAGTGLSNAASLDNNGESRTDSACTPVSSLVVAKRIAGTPTHSGTDWVVTYELTVRNDGAGAGAYDLDDTLQLGQGIQVSSISAVNSVPGGLPTAPGFDGVNQTRLTTNQAIAGGATHVYTVTVQANVPATITPAASDCQITSGEVGSGFTNTAGLVSGGSLQARDCTDPLVLAGNDPTYGGDQELPVTGGDVMRVLLLGALLTAAGSLMVVGRRRRRVAC